MKICVLSTLLLIFCSSLVDRVSTLFRELFSLKMANVLFCREGSVVVQCAKLIIFVDMCRSFGWAAFEVVSYSAPGHLSAGAECQLR